MCTGALKYVYVGEVMSCVGDQCVESRLVTTSGSESSGDPFVPQCFNTFNENVDMPLNPV